jgi:hypothetical protein
VEYEWSMSGVRVEYEWSMRADLSVSGGVLDEFPALHCKSFVHVLRDRHGQMNE